MTRFKVGDEVIVSDDPYWWCNGAQSYVAVRHLAKRKGIIEYRDDYTRGVDNNWGIKFDGGIALIANDCLTFGEQEPSQQVLKSRIAGRRLT